MAYANTSFPTPISMQHLPMNNVVQLRFGKRALSIRKDFRKRLYQPNLVIECYAGAHAGHLEILLLGHWLIVFSKAQN